MTVPTTPSPTLDTQWMPFTANKAFKARPRLLVSAKDMHYQSDDGREILDGTAGLAGALLHGPRFDLPVLVTFLIWWLAARVTRRRRGRRQQQ